MVERESRRSDGNADPVCPVCLKPIKPTDQVAGARDDLIHRKCDYAGRPPGLTTPRRE